MGRGQKVDLDSVALINYKNHIFKHLKIRDDHSSTKNLKNFNENLIEITKILELIKNQEEEFLFFVHLAASKIPDDNVKAEHYYSLIFLNELLDSNTKPKDFLTNWQNLYNIYYNKMEFKHLFDKEENLFDILFINYFMYEFFIRFYKLIEPDDYLGIISSYFEIDNCEVLYLIMENNDRFIKTCLVSSSSPSLYSQKEKVIEANLHLIYQLLEFYSEQYILSNKSPIFNEKLNNSLNFLKNLLLSKNDFDKITNESLLSISKVINLFAKYNLIINFETQNNKIITELLNLIVDLLIPSLPKTDDEKWNLFSDILNFCFFVIKHPLIESNSIKISMFFIINAMFQKPLIPLVKYKDITNILFSFFNGFILLKTKPEEYWTEIFRALYFVLSNNEDLFNSNEQIEPLWNLFIKKYLTAFVDYAKTHKFVQFDYKLVLTDIFTFSINKSKVELINFIS